jgi:hypothetical protein
MEDDHLREMNNQIGFRFNSDLFVVGKVNKIASEVREKSVSVNQMLDRVQIMTLSIMKDLGILREEDKDIFLITPIGIYSEIS